MASKYTRDDLRDIYETRRIPINSKTLKKQLSDGYKKYNHLVRILLDIIFSHVCGDLYINADKITLKINAIQQDIATLFGPRALEQLREHLVPLQDEISTYTLMLDLMKYYRKEIPMTVRECTQAKMAQRVINAMTKFENALDLPPYPKVEAISRIKQACGPISRDPSVAYAEKQQLKKFLKNYKYYANIDKYIK